MDVGDYVIVINAGRVMLTGNKALNMEYKHYSGYPSGLNYEKFETVLNKNPEKIIYAAVKRMLPDNKLSDQVIKKLKVYAGSEHKNAAQKPKEIKL